MPQFPHPQRKDNNTYLVILLHRSNEYIYVIEQLSFTVVFVVLLTKITKTKVVTSRTGLSVWRLKKELPGGVRKESRLRDLRKSLRYILKKKKDTNI
jgi:hypothetical protein